MTVMQDADARHRIEHDLETTFLVEAAAGTGKTTALIKRMISAVRSGARLDQMVAVTFTDKAAGELKLRLREALEDARQRDEVHAERFEAALLVLELTYVGTIHGFCGELLRERPVEAGVDPAFETMNDEDVEQLANRVFDRWFQKVLGDPPPGVARVLHMRRWGRDMGPRQLLRRALGDLIERRDYRRPWQRPPFEREARMLEVLDRMREVGALALSSTDERDYLRQALDLIRRFVREADARFALFERREVSESESPRLRAQLLDRLEADLRSFAPKSKPQWKWRGWGKKFGGLDKADVVEKRDALHELVDRFVIDAEQDLAAALQSELLPLVDEYEALKRERGQLDFLDLLLKARDLVREKSDVRTELQSRFSHLFIDEFQDTDPVQVELMLMLASAGDEITPGKLFAVGDPKQAVYRFRRADLAVYEDAKAAVTRAGGEVLDLTTSFRGVPSLQRFLNGAFSARMQEEQGVQARYVPLSPFRDEPAQPTVVALPIPEPYGNFGTAPWQSQVEASTPPTVGAFVHWLVRESGWRVGPEQRPVGFGDIALLFTRMASAWSDVTVPYVQSLSRHGIPHVLHGGRSFYDREEIAALRQLITAIEWPDDPLAVFATLRGPFLGFDDGTLLSFRAKTRTLPLESHPFHPLTDRSALDLDDAEQEVQRALTLLAELHRTRNERPFADTVSAFLEAARVVASLAFWPAPRQTLANVAQFVSHARRLETRGATSFRSFVRWIDDQAERGNAGATLDDGEGGVRLMTVHRAKGLEFPVVILCDPTAKETRTQPSRYVDSKAGLWATPLCQAVPADVRTHETAVLEADVAERVRVAYVAATRASDLLVVPAVGDDPLAGSWLRTLYERMYPADRQAATPAPGCPTFEGTDTVLVRNDKVRQKGVNPVRPGLHHVEGVEIVWWDPQLLRSAPAGGEMRRQALLSPNGDSAAASADAYEDWRKAREATLRRATEASRIVRSVSEVAADAAPEGLGVSIASTGAWTPARPSGARFGTLVHAVLAEIPFDAERDLVTSLAHSQGRILGATENEVAAAVEAVTTALGHPVLQRAAAAVRVRREVPITHRTSDGVLVEGVVDLAFEEDDPFGGRTWVVVDYKTDLDASGATDNYVVQVELYSRALAEATGAEVDGLLLGV